MDRQVESRTELQDPRVDATGGGWKRDDKGIGDQRAHQRRRTQDGRELDPAQAAHDGDERVPEPDAESDGQEGRGAPENLTKEALEAAERADRG